jgi:hypothetical protein
VLTLSYVTGIIANNRTRVNAHDLRRTNEDKRRAVLTLLQDEEWTQWSDREIARRCGVSHQMVAPIRSSLVVATSERIVTTKHGTVTTMNTVNIGSVSPMRAAVRVALLESPDELGSGMTDLRYYEIALQVPASEVPDDATVAERRFELIRHGGMIRLTLGPTVPGPGGESYSVLLASGHAQRIIDTLEVILGNLGR